MKRFPDTFGFFFTFIVLLGTSLFMPAETFDPQKAKADPDGKTLWYDGRNLLVEGKGWTNTEAFYDRLPAKAKGKVTDAVWGLSKNSAGLCVRFTTDAVQMQVRWNLTSAGLAMPHMPATGNSGVDLYGRDKAGQWQFLGNGRPAAVTNSANFSGSSQEYLLYLPLYNGVTLLEIGIPKDRTLSKPGVSMRKSEKPVVFYGTSITQGGCASRPGMACTAIVGRKLDVPIVNLGFSGSGRMEPAMADLLSELEPSIYVLDCLWNMTPAEVSERVEPFVKKLRSVHPATPIVLAEDSSMRNVPTGKGKILKDLYDKLVGQGVTNLYFVANEGMLGEDGEGTVDGCHPNDLGMMRQSAVFIKALTPLLQSPR